MISASHLWHEVAGDIEDDVGRGTKSWCGMGGREDSSGTEFHRDAVGPVIAGGEVRVELVGLSAAMGPRWRRSCRA